MTRRIATFFLFLSVIGISAPAFALDVPHDITNLPQVCATCHVPHGGLPSGWLTSDPLGIINLCQSCHNAAGPGTEVDTHESSTAAGEDFNFQISCNNCHDPHTQDQPTYGRFIREAIRLPDNSLRTVTLTQATGANSFADGDATLDGVCEVCHTQTITGSNSEPRHVNTGPGESARTQPHNPGTNCILCHAHNDTGPNNLGFRPTGGDCTQCHDAAKNQRRPVVAEFGNTSGHVKRNLVTEPMSKYDCVLCHLEGDANGDTTAFHNDAQLVVNLRDVDDPTNTSWKWQDPDNYSNTNAPNGKPANCATPNDMTMVSMFCQRCHDNNGIGDLGFINAVNANDSLINRSGTNPFGDGNAPLDIQALFDPSHTSSHSISCWWDASAAGCVGECPVGEHNQQDTGVCVVDETCTPNPCGGSATCSVVSGTAVCECPLNYVGANCNQCAPGYESGGYPTCGLNDTCAVDGAGAPCANGGGTCTTQPAGAPSEQIVQSDTAVNVVSAGPWTSQANANANAGTVLGAGSNGSMQIQFTTQAASANYLVWISVGRHPSNGGGGGVRPNISGNIDGTGFGGFNMNSSAWNFGSAQNWVNIFNTITLTAGTHTLTVTCGFNTTGCGFDGLVITTDTAFDPGTDGAMTPYASANWDAGGLDFYNDGAGGTVCQCDAGYLGPECLTCDTGYHLEDGACIADGTGACSTVFCDSLGTCYLTHNPANLKDTVPICDCNEQYYGSVPTACDLCDNPSTASWASGYNAPSTFPPGIDCRAWQGWDCADTGATPNYSTNTNWDQTATTECFNCHAPGNLGAAQPHSNNAHGAANTPYLLDDWVGTDTAFVDAVDQVTMTLVCAKCHNRLTYSNGADNAYTRWDRHSTNGMLDGADNIFGMGCLNCHGGGGWGSIHGESDIITDDDGGGTYSAIVFFNGASIDLWVDDGLGNITCSTPGTASGFNVGCTQHGSQSYTRQY